MAALEDYRDYYRRTYGIREQDQWAPSPQKMYYSDQPPIIPQPEDQQAADEEAAIKKYISIGVGWVSLIAENLLCHPFIVLRRQCQVNNSSKKYHLVPYTLIPVIVRLHQRQGITTLWKGLGSVLLVRGMTLGIEDLLSKVTPWPKDVDINTSVKSFFHHVLLKCVSLAIVTPFYSASLVETVQSDIASEKPGVLDVFREGAIRLVHWGLPKRGRLLPIWALIIPSVALGVARHLFFISVRGGMTKILQAREKYEIRKQGALPRDLVEMCTAPDNNVNATLIALITTDVLFFPLETILHRLHLQGTRTIVDDLDSGFSVLPILTNYEGPFDCYDKSLNAEGTSGLFKGFGAMILQYVVHITLVRGTKFLLTEVSRLMRSNSKPNHRSSPPVVYSNSDLSSQNYLVP